MFELVRFSENKLFDLFSVQLNLSIIQSNDTHALNFHYRFNHEK